MKELELARDAFNEYQNYPASKAKAERAHKLHIATLRAQIAEANETFTETWKARKVAVTEARDRTAKYALDAGATPHSLLAALGSNNPTWAYSLKNLDVAAETVEARVHPLLEGVTWDYSNHTGTHGVLRSADKELFKFYDLPLGEEWFIVDTKLELVTGSSALYESRTKPELERLTELLSSILDETYTGTLRLQNNPHNK